MTKSLLADGFSHHVWATLKLLDACAQLDPDGLDVSVPGIYGSIIDTLRHLVGADRSYLFVLTDGQAPLVDEESMGIDQLREVMERDGALWQSLLDRELDPDTVVVRRRDDGSESRAPLGVRLAQVLHHGTDHRSQVCTVLTSLGVTPPEIDVWDLAWEEGRLVETPAPA